MSKNKCMEQRLPKCVACEVDPMFDHECSSYAPAFWNGLSLGFVARLRVVDAERSFDGSWSTMVDGMRVHLASSDDQFRELVDKAVVWKRTLEVLDPKPPFYPGCSCADLPSHDMDGSRFHGRCKVCEELDPELIADRAAEAEQLRMDREDGIR